MSSPGKIDYKTVWNVLIKLGYTSVNRKGSHILLIKKRTIYDDQDRYVTLVCHKQIKKGTLLNIIRRTGLTKKEFLELL